MGRKILFVTTDQQRYDTLGCNGGTLARTPVVDELAATGIRFERAHPQSVVCMPSRATMLTGQYPTTHGVWMNGVPLPVDAPSVAATLHDAGYRTALIGKAHFEPFLDPFLRFLENALASTGTETGRGGRPPGFRTPRVRHPRRHGPAALRPLAHGRAPRGPRGLLPRPRRLDAGERRWAGATPAPPRSRPTRWNGAGTTPTGWPTAPSPGSIPWPTTTTGSLDELPRSPPPLGPARVRDGPDRLARRAPARPAIPRRPPSASRSSTPSPATGASGTTDAWCRTTRPRPTGCRRRSRPTRCER